MTIAAQYATALHHLPRIDWETLLFDLEKVVANKHFHEVLRAPYIHPDTLFKLINACLDHLNQKQKNFIYLLAKNRRLNDVTKIRKAYQQMQLVKKKQELVTITTAKPATPAQKKMIETYAKKHLDKRMTPLFKYQESESIIGGFVLTINSYTINQSVAKRLSDIREHIQGDHSWQHN